MEYLQIKQKTLLLVFIAFVGVHLHADECVGVHWSQNEEGKFRLESATNEPLTDYCYDKVYDFSHGVANVMIGETVGMVNSCGKEIAKPVYTFAPIRFGEVPIQLTYRGQPRYVCCLYNANLGGATWLDAEGIILQTGTKLMFRITDKVPDSLWDY